MLMYFSGQIFQAMQKVDLPCSRANTSQALKKYFFLEILGHVKGQQFATFVSCKRLQRQIVVWDIYVDVQAQVYQLLAQDQRRASRLIYSGRFPSISVCVMRARRKSFMIMNEKNKINYQHTCLTIDVYIKSETTRRP